MTRSDDQTTPHPPATAEFGYVTPGGPAHRYPLIGDVSVVKLSVGPYDNNVYVIRSAGQAIVIDGAAEPDRILSEVDGLEVTAIVQTHNHPDHVAALPRLVEALGCPVLAHPEDPMPVRTDAIGDGDRLNVGSADIAVMHTPGHTPGSLCFLLGDDLFTGDTLFPGGPGNTRGNRSAFETIMQSLDRLFELPDATRVSPGHGLDTTLERERPYLEVWRTRGW